LVSVSGQRNVLTFYCNNITIAFVTFGRHLRGLRVEKGLTQRKLAELVGVDFTYLSKIENDREGYRPGEDLIRKLAGILGTNADELTLLAAMIPSEIERKMTGNPKAQEFFLRTAGDLTDKEWNVILEVIRKRKKP
jgi:transcriptional regulator with XRE-family HTH domain